MSTGGYLRHHPHALFSKAGFTSFSANVFFSISGPNPLSQIAFSCHVSSFLQPMAVPVLSPLNSTFQLFYRMPLSFGLSDVFFS